jgi:hypothetical protein
LPPLSELRTFLAETSKFALKMGEVRKDLDLLMVTAWIIRHVNAQVLLELNPNKA